jgi:hypothetical protein
MVLNINQNNSIAGSGGGVVLAAGEVEEDTSSLLKGLDFELKW